MPQSPIQITCSNLFTPGRACAGPTAVVLHEINSGLEMYDSEACRCLRPRPLTSPGCHASFHFAVGGNCNFHQYVPIADTAWGFYFIPTPACPDPPCPIVQTCDGIGADQYNPEEDGTLATPDVTIGPDFTANCSVIHVGVITGISSINAGIYCINSPDFSENAYRCLVQSLCYIYQELGFDPTGYDNLLTHVGEFVELDLTQLAIDIIECIDFVPPPLPPCNCAQTEITVVDSTSLNLTASGVDDHTLTGVVIVSPNAGNDLSILASGLYVANTDIAVVDTNSVNLTASGTDNHTLQADVIISPNAGNDVSILASGLFVPVELPNTATDTDSVNLTLSGTFNRNIQADVVISDLEDNQLQLISGFNVGLYVPLANAQLPLVDCDDNPIAENAIIATVENFVENTQVGGSVVGLISMPAVDPDTCPVTLLADICANAGVANLNNQQFLGSDGTDLSFVAYKDPVLQSGADSLDVQTELYALGKSIILATGNIVLTNPPIGACSYKELYIKNLAAVPITITAAQLIDGQGLITLQGTSVGSYPFGNDGGESVHLVWSDGLASWFVL